MIHWALNIVTIVFLLLGNICSGQIDSLYTVAIKKADSSYDFRWSKQKDDPADKEKFEAAKELYIIALQIKPTETYPASRLKEIDKILYDFKTKPIYQSLIAKADSLFLIDILLTAKKYYYKADSLYPNEYTKEKLDAIFALINILENPSDSIIFIKHGSSFGMCDGYCYEETKYTNDSIKIIIASWHGKLPDKINKIKMNGADWQNMVKTIDIKSFFKLPKTIGCPDCLDGGAEWIIIGTNRTEWKVTFDYGEEIPTFKNLLEIIRQTNEEIGK